MRNAKETAIKLYEAVKESETEGNAQKVYAMKEKVRLFMFSVSRTQLIAIRASTPYIFSKLLEYATRYFEDIEYFEKKMWGKR